MIVRLKVVKKTDNTASVMFQFYDSPIKSACKRFYKAFLFKFQFYDSPIKRQTKKAYVEERMREVSIL